MGRPALFLLGMHAGGAADVASVLADANATLGGLTPAAASACEARLAPLCDDALCRLGIGWDSPAAVGERAHRADALRELQPSARDLFAELFGKGGAVVLSDPRFCRLMPFWRDVAEQAGFAASVVMVVRRPREVAAALARKSQFAPEKSLALWHHHLVEGERGSRGLPRALVSYEQWLADPQAVLARIAAQSAFPLAASSAAKASAERLRRANAPSEARNGGSMQSGLDKVLDAAYERLCALPAGMDAQREIEAMEASARPAMISAIAPWLEAELTAARDLAVRLSADLVHSRQRGDSAVAELSALKAQSSPDAAVLATQLDALREDRAREREVMVGELAKTRGEIERLSAAVAEAPRTAETMRSELAQAHRDLYDERAAITRLTEEVESARRDADGYAKRFQSAHLHLETLAAELAEVRDHAMSRDNDYTVISDELGAWRTQAGELEAERDKLVRERDRAMREVSRMTTEVEALKHARDAAIDERERVNETMRQAGQALAVLRDDLPRRAAVEAQLGRERDGLVTALKAAQERIAALEAMLGDRSSYITELVARHNTLAARLVDLEKRALVRAAVKMGGAPKKRSS